jgi:hypothetical protein
LVDDFDRRFMAGPLVNLSQARRNLCPAYLLAEHAERDETGMIRIGGCIAFILAATNPSFAQDYCEQVKQGIAQYGYAAARQYAVEHYTREEVRAADRCVIKTRLRRHS